MANKQTPGKCIFCEGIGMTKQHIWPNWMNRAFPKNENSHTNLKLSVQSVFGQKQRTLLIHSPVTKKLNGNIGSRQLRLVCSKCNMGWMSKIDEQSKDLIIALMTHQDIILSQEQHLTLAAWIAQITIVAEFTDIPMKAIPYSERKYFMDNQLPPSTWAIWIGKCKSTNWQELAYQHRGILSARLMKDNNGVMKEVKREVATQSSAFTIGGLYILALSTKDADLNQTINDFTYPELVRLWPLNTVRIDWSSLPIVLDTDHLTESVLVNFMANPIRGIKPDGTSEVIEPIP
jgi:hypothetical protein